MCESTAADLGVSGYNRALETCCSKMETVSWHVPTSLMTSLTWLQLDERALKYTKNKIIKFEGYCIAFAVAVSPNALHIVLEDGQY